MPSLRLHCVSPSGTRCYLRNPACLKCMRNLEVAHSQARISDMLNRQPTMVAQATRMIRCCPTGHGWHANTKFKRPGRKENWWTLVCESRTKMGKQHSISHIVEKRVVFTGRLVKTV